ncbi:MAG: EamA family transporter [Nanoarchaeota archaeon]|nr:EamA family transporter [Nanoarchaeota archaeon]
MEWYVYVLISAFFIALSNIAGKKALFKVHAMEYRTTLKVLEIPLLLLLIPFLNFNIDPGDYIFIFLIAFIAVVAGIFWAKAIKHSEISTVSPLQNLSPIFLVILSFIILKETVTLQQGIGIAILIIGTYVLEVDHKISNLKEPILKIIKTRTIHFVLISLFLYSLSAVGDKYMITSVDKVTYLFWVWMFMTIISLAISSIFYKGLKDVVYCIKKSGWIIFLAGLFSFISALAYFKALTMVMVSLLIPLKRLSTLFATLIGGELFHDHGLKLKAVACVILIVGALLVVL